MRVGTGVGAVVGTAVGWVVAIIIFGISVLQIRLSGVAEES